MSKIFLGGTRKIPRLNSSIRTKINNIIANRDTVLVGDANGADKAFQKFLNDLEYEHVVVYHMDDECRNNLGAWKKRSIKSGGRKKDFKYFILKDEEMSREADSGLMLWDGKSKGTLNNILNLIKQQKSVLTYFSLSKNFVWVKSPADVEALVCQCDSESKKIFDRTINFSTRLQPQQETIPA